MKQRKRITVKIYDKGKYHSTMNFGDRQEATDFCARHGLNYEIVR